MYDLSGIKYFIYYHLIIALIALFFLLCEKPWNKSLKSIIKEDYASLLVILVFLCFAFKYVLVMLNPSINTFVGEYQCSYKYRAQTYYSFLKYDGTSKTFSTTVTSNDSIIPNEFIEGVDYIIHYEEDTAVIVKVEQ